MKEEMDIQKLAEKIAERAKGDIIQLRAFFRASKDYGQYKKKIHYHMNEPEWTAYFEKAEFIIEHYLINALASEHLRAGMDVHDKKIIAGKKQSNGEMFQELKELTVAIMNGVKADGGKNGKNGKGNVDNTETEKGSEGK